MPDAPVIVLLPGLDGTGRMFGPFAHALAAQYDVRVLRYPTDAALGYEALTRLVRAELPTACRFFIVAESFAGPIGCALAAQRVPGLAGLVLCASFASSPLPWLRPIAPWLRFAPVRAVPLQLISWLLLGRWSTPALVDELRRALHEVEPAVLRQRAQVALTANAVAPTQHTGVPVLYLQAGSDRLVPRSAARRLRGTFPEIEVVRVAGPHFLLQAEPLRCAGLVIEFVQRSAASAQRRLASSGTESAAPDELAPAKPGGTTPRRP